MRVDPKWIAAGVGGIASLLIYFEGSRTEPYLDVIGVPTVCVGHTGADVVMGKAFTAQQCGELLAADIAITNGAIDTLVKVPLNANQRTALQSFIFNVGINAFAQSTLLKKLNAGDYAGAAAQMDRWVLADGKKVQGLVNRRAEERALFETASE